MTKNVPLASLVLLLVLSGQAVAAPSSPTVQARPSVSREFPGSDPVTSSAPDIQTAPAVAWGTGSYLVVWQDDRNGSSDTDIYGARVSPGGTVLDVAGIPIANAARRQVRPGVAFDGTNFLVVWQDGDVSDPDQNVFGARVSQSGQVLDDTPISIATEAGNQVQPSVAWNGETFLVAWGDGRDGTGSDLYGTRVAPDGTVLDGSGLLLFGASPPEGAFEPRLAWGGADYLMAWNQFRSGSDTDILAERLDANGVVLDPQPLAISVKSDFQYDQEVAVGDGLFFVSYYDQNVLSAPVRGTRVTAGGEVLDPSGIAVGSTNTGAAAPAVGWDGRDFLIAWDHYLLGEGNHVHAARVTTAGVVLDPAGIEVSDQIVNLPSFAIGSDGTQGLVTWGEAQYDPESDVDGARLGQDGTILDPTAIVVSTEAANMTVDPAVAWNGSLSLMTWQDERLGFSSIFATRVTRRGTALDGTGIPITTDGPATHPTVTSDGTNFLVAWEKDAGFPGGDDVLAARVGPDGQILDPDPIDIRATGGDQYSPAVGFNGTNYLAAWVNDERVLEKRNVYVRRLSPDGQLLEQPILVSVAGAQTAPAIASDGDEWLVVWQKLTTAQWDVFGARVSASGEVLDSSPILISTGPADETAPTVAWDGTDFVVGWADLRLGTGKDIYAARVAPDGTVRDPAGIAVSTAAGDQDTPSAAWEGSNVLMTWADLRSGASSDVVGARLSVDGHVVDVRGAAISHLPTDETQPAVTATSAGRALVAYQRFATEPRYAGVDRVFFRFFAEAPVGGPS